MRRHHVPGRLVPARLLLSAAVRRERVRLRALLGARPLPLLLRGLALLPDGAAEVLLHTRVAYLAHLQARLAGGDTHTGELRL